MGYRFISSLQHAAATQLHPRGTVCRGLFVAGFRRVGATGSIFGKKVNLVFEK